MSDTRSTALHAAACSAPTPDSVILLICSGADETITNKQGLTPVQEAKMVYLEIFELKKKGFEAMKAAYPVVNHLKNPVPF